MTTAEETGKMIAEGPRASSTGLRPWRPTRLGGAVLDLDPARDGTQVGIAPAPGPVLRIRSHTIDHQTGLTTVWRLERYTDDWVGVAHDSDPAVLRDLHNGLLP